MPLGNSELAGIAYYSGNPSAAQVVGFDVAKGTLVIDQTNGEVYQKIAAQGTNTGGYVTIGSQMERVTDAVAAISSYVDIVGLTGFALEAGTTYKVSGSLPITAANGVAINLSFLTAATVGFYSIGTVATTANHVAAAPASVTNVDVYTGTTAVTYITFEAIIITALATTMKVRSKYTTGPGAIVALGGTVTVTKVL